MACRSIPHCFHWLHVLRIFFIVAEQRSFLRPAATLFVSQPAEPKAVRELGHQLDLPLLDRAVAGAKDVRLAENGAALFDQARGLRARAGRNRRPAGARRPQARPIGAPLDAPLARRRRPTVHKMNDQVWLLREPGSGTREVTERMMRW